jgi:hypothetical protein
LKSSRGTKAEFDSAVVSDHVSGCSLLVTDREEFGPWERRVYSVKVGSGSKTEEEKKIEYSKKPIEFGDAILLEGREGQIRVSVNSTSITVTETKDAHEVTWSLGLYLYRDWPHHAHQNIKNKVGIYVMNTMAEAEAFGFSEAYVIRTANASSIILQDTSYPATALHLIHDISSPTELKVRFSVAKLFQPIQKDFVVRISFPGLPPSSNEYRSFYTDSNGQDVMKRSFDPSRKVEQSYFPFTSFISIPVPVGGKFKAVSILSDRPTGGSIPKPGVIEIGVSRNNIGKDNCGVPEGAFDIHNTHTEFKIVWEEEAFSKPELAVPANRIRRQQLESDTSLLLATLPTFDLSLARSAVQSDVGSSSLVEGVKGNCAGQRETADLVRLVMDTRSEGLMVRVYNLNEECTVKIASVSKYVAGRLGLERGVDCEERSVDFNLPAAEALVPDQAYLIQNRLREMSLRESSLGESIVLKPLKYKTFKLKLK